MFKRRLLLISGWGLGPERLMPLKQALEQQALIVDVVDIFDALDPVRMHSLSAQVRAYEVIVGWSLGGQLASCLIENEALKNTRALVTISSNPCFVASDEWPLGMAKEQFATFKNGFQTSPQSTLKKFLFLITQGSSNAKQEFSLLQEYLPVPNIDLLQKGLRCLEQLQRGAFLKQLTLPQYHLFAKQDALVNVELVSLMQSWQNPSLSTEVIEEPPTNQFGNSLLGAQACDVGSYGSHSLVLFHSQFLAHKITGFLRNV